MSNITSYLRSGQYVYKEWKHFENASGASGASDVVSSSNASNASVSNASIVQSGASGAVYEYGGVQNLNVEQVIELFREGKLTVEEMDKWLDAHEKEITKVSYRKTSSVITYKFTYNNTEYSVSCTPQAAKSQTDNVFQRTYSKGEIESYKQRYNLTDDDIAKYFVLASYNGTEEFYAINPKSGIKDINEFKKIKEAELKEAEAKAAKEAAATEAADTARAARVQAAPIGDRVNEALDQQPGLGLVKCDEYENERGRIVAVDNDYNLYDFDTVKNIFVKRTKEDIVNYILGAQCNLAGGKFNITDVVRLVNRELALQNDKDAFIENYKKTLAEFNGYTYRGITYDKNSFATGKDGKTYMYNDTSKEYQLDRDFDIVTVAEKQKLHYAGNGLAYDDNDNKWEYNKNTNTFNKAGSGGGNPGSSEIDAPIFEGGPNSVKVSFAVRASIAQAASIEDKVNEALDQQPGLGLVKFDEYENERGRIVAVDDDYNLYDFDTVKNKFVKRTKEAIVNYILGEQCNLAGGKFNITDVVRLVNRELALQNDKDAFIDEFRKTLAEFNGYTYRGNTYDHFVFATGKDGKTYSYNKHIKEYQLDRDFDIVTVAEKQNLHYAGYGLAYDDDKNTWEYDKDSQKFVKVSGGGNPGSSEVGTPGFEGGPTSVKAANVAQKTEINLNNKLVNEDIIQKEPEPQGPEIAIVGTVSEKLVAQYRAVEDDFAKGNLSLNEALMKVGGWLNGEPEVIDGVYIAHYQVGNYFGTFKCDADKVKADVVKNRTIAETDTAPTILPPQQPTIERIVYGTIPDADLEKYHSAEEEFAKGNLSLSEALMKVGGWLNGEPEVVDGVYIAHYQVGNYFGTFKCDADKVKPDTDHPLNKEE